MSVVATVTSNVTFPGICDFQYVNRKPEYTKGVAPKADAIATDVPFGEDDQEMMVVPALFSRDDLPHDYAFKGAKGRQFSKCWAGPPHPFRMPRPFIAYFQCMRHPVNPVEPTAVVMLERAGEMRKERAGEGGVKTRCCEEGGGRRRRSMATSL